MHMAHRSIMPTEAPWAFVGGLLLSFAFVVALALILLQWMKHPGRFFEERYGPVPDDTAQPRDQDREIEIVPE